MRLKFSDDVERFRAEFIAWLTENRPSEEEMKSEPAVSSAHIPKWAQSWAKRLFANGWLVPGWPPERGGRNATAVEQLVYLEELTRAGVPRTTNPQGLGIIAPSIFDYGNEEQIRKFALPILRGEMSGCLGMSEPGAGSDLAGLTTKALLDGDAFVIDGQKVWTSGANYADFCFLFCRTDLNLPKHKGISVIIVPMNASGVSVRPLPEIIDPANPDLNEVFFDKVVVDRANLVGEMNRGWFMANGSLAHERGMVWLTSVMTLEADMRRMVADAPECVAGMAFAERTIMLDQVVQCYVDAVAARCLGYRGFSRQLRGGTAPEQALMKAYSSESRRRAAQVEAELRGGLALDATATSRLEDRGWLERYFGTFTSTISAGTSEIQRNIIAERVLGLPRD